MIALFSVADASIVVAFIGLGATWVTSHRNRRDIKQINTAVNHQQPGEPTLVQRVKMIEARAESHAKWEKKAFDAIAMQLGITLPDRPED